MPQKTTILFTLELLLALALIAESGSESAFGDTSSTWLKLTAPSNHWIHHPPRPGGCRKQPRVCNPEREWPPKKKCCQNACIDVWSDPNHCGHCRSRCPFSWQCCQGRCRNTNKSHSNCGKCGNKCPVHVRCVYGMCGYDEPPKSPKHNKHHPRRPMPTTDVSERLSDQS